MPDVKSGALRIYCICGQKMKVSDKMYGLPGKCVACRQKIRIPRKDEVPEGVTDIHLKDHPELLRGAPKAVPISDEEREARRALADAGGPSDSGSGESTPNTELDLIDSPPVAESTKAPPAEKKKRAGASVPLETLPQLQALCSLDYKLSRQLDTLQLNDHEDEVLLAELEGHLSRVRKLRIRLNDHLHQVLMETAIELANTQEKLAAARLEARVGEIAWQEYQTVAHRLRTRRDRLERRQQNLRGWLAVKDPYLAGGLLDLSVESIPRDETLVSLPAEAEDEGAPLATLTGGLREAFEERMRVRQRLDEVQRMGDGAREIEELKKAVAQQRLLARARVAFYQDRLQQLKKDYASDVETANAALGIARDKLRVDEIARGEYDALEREVLRSKRDIARAQSVISRALGANAASDVPSPRGTFLQRLGVTANSRTTPDLVADYAAVVLLCACIFAPSIGTMSLVTSAIEYTGTGGAPAWLFAGPISLAVIVAIASRVLDARARGLAMLGICLLGVAGAAYLVHAGEYGLGSIASRFRTGSQWYLRPGVLLYVLGMAALFLGGGIALWPVRSQRLWPAAAAAAAAIAAFMIFTDTFGAFRPRPGLEVSLTGADSGEGVVRITNVGGRPVHLLNRPADARGAYQFVIERRVGATGFGPAIGEGPMWEDSAVRENGLLFSVDAGGVREVPFALPPGEYRALIESRYLDAPISALFEIEESAQVPASEPPAPVIAPAPSAPPSVSAIVPNAVGPDEANLDVVPEVETADEVMSTEEPVQTVSGGPEVELNGILATPGESPRFTIDIFYQDGSDERLSLVLGGVVWGDWAVEEFNPDQRTVTLSREGRFLILRRGTPVVLPQ